LRVNGLHGSPDDVFGIDPIAEDDENKCENSEEDVSSLKTLK
jgi:hypothetical protein